MATKMWKYSGIQAKRKEKQRGTTARAASRKKQHRSKKG
jgi:hypothetical protein